MTHREQTAAHGHDPAGDRQSPVCFVVSQLLFRRWLSSLDNRVANLTRVSSDARKIRADRLVRENQDGHARRIREGVVVEVLSV